MFADVVIKLRALEIPVNIVRFRVGMTFRFLA